MTKEEKTAKTREKIINAAITMFGEKGYDVFTINSLCTTYNVSKGLLYHNFSGKDDLYIKSVEKCYLELINYLKKENEVPTIYEYIERRLEFFRNNPWYARIFFESLVHTNNEIYEKIQEIRKNLILLNKKVYLKLIKGIKLREGVSEESAVNYFNLIQSMFNGYFSNNIFRGKNIEFILEEQEKNLKNILDLVIYGIGEK